MEISYNALLNITTNKSDDISPGIIELRSMMQSDPDILKGRFPFTPTTDALAPAFGLNPRIVTEGLEERLAKKEKTTLYRWLH